MIALGRRRAPTAAILAAVLAAGLAFAADGSDPKQGEALFRACRACHQIGPGARNAVGPHLDGLFGRQAASIEGFRYSEALRSRGASGLVWDAEALDAYLERPQAYAPGTRMSYRGMASAADRSDLIAYLAAASASAPASDPAAAPAPRAEIGAAALALEGDAAYGEYLAAECVTCHQLSGHADGIPSIVGWPKEAFVRALFEYKTNVRDHQVMKIMTANLGNEEIAALAAYFSALSPQ